MNKLLLFGSRLKRIQRRYDLYDTFNDARAAGAIDGTLATDGVNERKATDSENKLTQSSGDLVCAGGKAAPSQGDPGIWYPAQDREAGKILAWTVTLNETNKSSQLGWDTNTAGDIDTHHIRLHSNGMVYVYSTGTGLSKAVGIANTAEGVYSLALRSSGSHFFKGNTLLWSADGSVQTPVYPSYSNYHASWAAARVAISKTRWLPPPLLSDGFGSAGALATSDGLGHAEGVAGGLGSGGVATYETNTWESDGSVASSGITLGTERIDDGDMEAVGVADWADDGTPTTKEKSGAQKHGGAQSLHVVSDAASEGVQQGTITGLVDQTWYHLDAWIYRVSGDIQGILQNDFPSGFSFSTGGATNTWLNYIVINRTVLFGGWNSLIKLRSIGAGGEWYADDVSLKAIPIADTMCASDFETPDVLASAEVTLTAGTQAGVVARLDDATTPANFLLAYHDGTNAHLEKCVGGTYTSLIDTAAAYSAGKRLIVVCDGNSVDLYYNDAKIGTTQTVSDAGIVDNTLHGTFSTYDSNTIDDLQVWKRNGYNVPS